MSDAVVNADHAVRSLRRAVGRYADSIRDATASARREVAAADRKAQDAVGRCRSELQRREHELKAAQAALARCREDCGRQHQAVNAAAQRHTEAKQKYERARKATQLTAAAQTDLLKVLQTVEATVGEHSSVASSALASLDGKLAELSHLDLGRAVHNVAVGIAVTAGIVGATMDISRGAANTAAAFGVDIPIRDHSITEMVEHRKEQEVSYVADKLSEATKRKYSGQGETDK